MMSSQYSHSNICCVSKKKRNVRVQCVYTLRSIFLHICIDIIYIHTIYIVQYIRHTYTQASIRNMQYNIDSISSDTDVDTQNISSKLCNGWPLSLPLFFSLSLFLCAFLFTLTNRKGEYALSALASPE